MYGYGTMSGGGMVMMLLLIVVLSAATALVTTLLLRRPASEQPPPRNARDILDSRLAGGELTDQDYQQRRDLIDR